MSSVPEKQTNPYALVGPSVGNFCVQYNFQVIAIALEVAARVTAQKDWVATQNKSVIFVGCILGQFLMGYAGDLLGRSRALSLTLGLAVVGALGSSVAAWGDPTTLYTTIIAFRLLIGFGLGGVYPLSATKAAEANEDPSASPADRRAAAVGRASRAFFWQGPGMCAPYVVAIVVRAVLTSDAQDMQWRLLLGLGAVPALVAMAFLRLDAADDAAKRTPDGGATNAALGTMMRRPGFWKTFAGTGGGWLLYDVAFYGFGLMGPQVVEACFHGENSIQATSWQQLVALAFNVPALWVSVKILTTQSMTIKRLQILGFFGMAASYVLYGALRFAGVGPWYLFACYCLLNFTLSFGPNVTTFVLPAATYPAETRSTMAGLSSAAGKLGAVLGTELLPVLNQTYSLNVVLVTCVATSLAGAALTAWAVDEICDEEPPPDVDATTLLGVNEGEAQVA